MIDAFVWLYMHAFDPIIRACYTPLDWVLGWTSAFNAIVALVIVGVITGFLVNLFQKFLGNQKLLASCKADLDLLKKKMKEAKQTGQAPVAQRLASLTGKISGKYMWGSLIPAFWSVPVLCVLATWTGVRMSYEPVRPGQKVELIAHFEDGASGYAHIVSNATTPAPIALVALPPKVSTSETKAATDSETPHPQSKWELNFEKAGKYPIAVRHNDKTYKLEVEVFEKSGRAPETIKGFSDASPGKDELTHTELKLEDTVPKAWWNFNQRWMGVYLIAALLSGLALRRVMGIS